MSTRIYRRTLTIAGSDSGGGAGIQADLKTFAALSCYGMSVITAITAQNTVAVTAIHEVPVSIIRAQLQAILDDIGVDAVKIGMLQSPQIIQTVTQVLKEYQIRDIVVDPVMVAKSGDKLLHDDAIGLLKSELLPIATIITPNLPESEVLTGMSHLSTPADIEKAGLSLLSLGPQAVLVKGGHGVHQHSVDCLISVDQDPIWLETERVHTKNTHGTGCTLSSAITAFLARKNPLVESVRLAKKYISQAIRMGAEYSLGSGHGPVHHFFEFWV